MNKNPSAASFSPQEISSSKSDLKLNPEVKTLRRSPSEFHESQMNYCMKRDQKIELMRNEKLENTNKNMYPIPEILEKSKEIFENSSKEKQVHNRLYNDKFEREKKKALEKEKESEKDNSSKL